MSHAAALLLLKMNSISCSASTRGKLEVFREFREHARKRLPLLGHGILQRLHGAD